MAQQDNVTIVRRGYEAFSRGDIDTLVSLLDERVEWTSPGPKDLPTAGKRTGRDEVKQFLRAVDELLEFQEFEPQTFIAEGDRVVVLGVDTATVKGTGASISDSWAHAFTVKNGKITHFQEYIDTAALVAELRAAQART